MKNLLMMSMFLAVGLMMGCAAKPCGDFAKEVCAKAPGTQACERASRLTSNDECRDLLKEVDRYVQLTNLQVTAPGVQPPAPPPPAPEPAAPAPDAVQAPAPVVPPVGTPTP